MKIAYLILAHKQIDQMNKLISALDDGNSDFFIHIDSKVAEFSEIQKPNVIYLKNEERKDIRWGSYEMVLATLNLIKRCLNNPVNYEYVILLSGQDFPIKSNTYIQNFLSNGKESNYICFFSDINTNVDKINKRNALVYPLWLQRENIFSRILKRFYISFSGGYAYTFPFFKKKNPLSFNLYYGSQWWALRRECLIWMMEYLDSNPQFTSFFETSLIPDESFFQTLFMLSPYSGTKKNNLHFVEWDEQGKHPVIIDKKRLIELENERNDEFLFARKFDIKIHKDAIDYLMEKRCG